MYFTVGMSHDNDECRAKRFVKSFCNINSATTYLVNYSQYIRDNIVICTVVVIQYRKIMKIKQNKFYSVNICGYENVINSLFDPMLKELVIYTTIIQLSFLYFQIIFFDSL